MNAQTTIEPAAGQEPREPHGYEQFRHSDGTRSKHYGLPCPHCGSATKIRTSDLVEPTFRVIWFDCTYFPCGFAFRASLAFEYGTRPSAIPKPGLELAMRLADRSDLIDDRKRAMPGPEPNPLPLFD